MRLMTVKSLLIVVVAMVILVGCNSGDNVVEMETETATVETATEGMSETETESGEVETTTVEETVEEETSTVEETTTATSEDINSTDIADVDSSTADLEDAATRRANYKSKYRTDYNADYDIYSWLDDDGDGLITDEEAAFLEDSLDEIFSKYLTSDSSASSSSDESSSSSSLNPSWTPMDPTVPDRPNASEMDGTGLSTTGEVY